MTPSETGGALDTPGIVFVMSLPRSGSTLCQRILAAHSEVSTAPEPTFLLPLLNLASTTDVVATYDQLYTSWAIEDFVNVLPHQSDDLRTATRMFADSLYRAAGNGARYFIDKTPKYHFVAADVAQLFPDAHIILLWRNPLAVIASLMATWGPRGGQWNLHHFRIDLFEGLDNLVQLQVQHPDQVFALRYEDLVSQPLTEIRKLFEHLDLEFDPGVLDRFGELDLPGRVQDPNLGSPEFKRLRADRVNAWEDILANPLRKRWCRRYLEWIGHDRLELMGYDLDPLLDQLSSIGPSTRFLASDLYRRPYDTLYRTFELRLVKAKVADRRRGRRMYAHK